MPSTETEMLLEIESLQDIINLAHHRLDELGVPANPDDDDDLLWRLTYVQQSGGTSDLQKALLERRWAADEKRLRDIELNLCRCGLPLEADDDERCAVCAIVATESRQYGPPNRLAEEDEDLPPEAGEPPPPLTRAPCGLQDKPGKDLCLPCHERASCSWEASPGHSGGLGYRGDDPQLVTIDRESVVRSIFQTQPESLKSAEAWSVINSFCAIQCADLDLDCVDLGHLVEVAAARRGAYVDQSVAGIIRDALGMGLRDLARRGRR